MYSQFTEGVLSPAGPALANALPRILLVDDEPIVLRVTACLLHNARFAVTSVQSGEEALAKLQSESYDLILTDFKMAGKSGADVAIAARQVCPETPVILMTGLIHDVPDWMRRGELALPIVAKPFLKTELLHAVNRALLE